MNSNQTSKPVILNVDDNATSLYLVSRILDSNGFDTISASSGEEAIMITHNRHVDLILLDINLPGIDGFETAKKLASDKKTSSIPIVHTSATYTDASHVIEGLQDGACAYLNHPIEPGVLIGTINSLLRFKKIEKEKNEESNICRDTFNSISDGIIVIDEEGRVIKCNDAFLEITGKKFTSIIGKPFLDLFTKSRKNISDDFLSFVNLFSKRKINEIEINGRLMDIISNPIFDEDKKCTGFAYIFHDITAFKKNETKLKNSLNKIRAALSQTIGALGQILESRDPYTAVHQKNVAKIANLLAEDMGFNDERKQFLEYAALIHDIGKITIPVSILTKPGVLSEIEMALIKTHSTAGYNILKDIDFSYPISEIILQHHERFDGSGYPDGLKHADILLEAKIIGVCDVADAMSSHRPYRPAKSKKAVLEELSQKKGILYDPDVVDSFLKLVNNTIIKIPV